MSVMGSDVEVRTQEKIEYDFFSSSSNTPMPSSIYYYRKSPSIKAITLWN